MKIAQLLSVVVLVSSSACGGGGGGTQPPGTPPSHGGGPDMAKVIFSVVIPSASATSNSHTRKPYYISSNTQSLSVTVNSESPQIFSLTPATNANCVATAGTTTCSNLQAVAPPGTDSFAFGLYASTNATGTPLSVANVANKVIQLGVSNQLGNFTLNPVIGTISLGIAGTYTAGTSSSGNAINVAVKDPSGATIIAPGSYVNSSDTLTPINLTSTASSFSFSVDSGSTGATGTLSTPSDSATLSYNGDVGSTTIEAAAGSISATPVVINPTAQPVTLALASSASGADYLITTSPAELDFYESGITGTVTPSEAGYVGSFTLQSSTCSASEVSFSPVVGRSVPNGNSFSVNALAAGSAGSPAICTATFADSNGQTASATFSVTTISFGLQ